MLNAKIPKTPALLSITPYLHFSSLRPEFMQISLVTPRQYEPLSRHSLRTVQRRKESGPGALKGSFFYGGFWRFLVVARGHNIRGVAFSPRRRVHLAPGHAVTTACRTCAPTRESRPEPRPSGPGSARPARLPHLLLLRLTGTAARAVLRSPSSERQPGHPPPAWTLAACG